MDPTGTPHRGFAAAAPGIAAAALGTLSPQSPVHSRPCRRAAAQYVDSSLRPLERPPQWLPGRRWGVGVGVPMHPSTRFRQNLSATPERSGCRVTLPPTVSGNYGPGTPHTPRRSDDNTAEPHPPLRRTFPLRRTSLLFHYCTTILFSGYSYAYCGRRVSGRAGGQASERATGRPGDRAGRHAGGSTVPWGWCGRACTGLS